MLARTPQVTHKSSCLLLSSTPLVAALKLQTEVPIKTPKCIDFFLLSTMTVPQLNGPHMNCLSHTGCILSSDAQAVSAQTMMPSLLMQYGYTVLTHDALKSSQLNEMQKCI